MGAQIGIVLILVGFGIAVFGAKVFTKPEPFRAVVFQGPLGNFIILIIQLIGWGLVIYGVVKLFV